MGVVTVNHFVDFLGTVIAMTEGAEQKESQKSGR